VLSFATDENTTDWLHILQAQAKQIDQGFRATTEGSMRGQRTDSHYQQRGSEHFSRHGSMRKGSLRNSVTLENVDFDNFLLEE